MSAESNKAIVRRYFEEVLDKRKLDILDEMVTTNCIIHRPEASEPIRGLEAFKQALERILQVYSEFTTTIHDLIAEEHRVACRLSHRAVNRGDWTSPLGTHPLRERRSAGRQLQFFEFGMGKSRKNGSVGTSLACSLTSVFCLRSRINGSDKRQVERRLTHVTNEGRNLENAGSRTAYGSFFVCTDD